jgi:ubiquinone/menaquinone biosynthesis C-methylase UbiE
MSFHRNWVLPHLLNGVMQISALSAYRERRVPAARGRVIEIGIGSGLNLPWYRPREVSEVVGIDPSRELLEMARRRAARMALAVEFLEDSAESLPLPDGHFDTAVVTWTLCSIPDPVQALREIRRVLKPEGRLLFVEHGLAPEPWVAGFQRRATPFWRRCSGGCHLDRPIDRLIREAGFGIEDLSTGYANRMMKPMTFMYEGCARA